MTFDDVLKIFQDQADSLQLSTVVWDKKKYTALGDTITNADEESINIQKKAKIKALEYIMTTLSFSKNELIDSKATLNGYTALHQAIESDNLDLVRALLDCGANPLVENAKGDSAIMLAAKLGRRSILEEFGAMVHEESSKFSVSQASHSTESESKIPITSQAASKVTEESIEVAPVRFNHSSTSRRVVLDPLDLSKVTDYLMGHAKKNANAGQYKALVSIAGHDKNYLAQYKLTLAHMLESELRELNKTHYESKHSDSDNKKWKEACQNYQKKFFDSTKNYERPNLQEILSEEKEIAAGALLLLENYTKKKFSNRHFKLHAMLLVAAYPDKKITHFDKFIEFYDKLEKVYNQVVQAKHDKKANNNIDNSEFCRRLEFILQRMRDTAAIRNKLDKQKYKATVESRIYASNLSLS